MEKLDESWNQRRIERWFRRKKAQGARPLTAKFGETMWRGFFYTIAYSYGSYVVLANSWFWNTLDCWTNYPMHDLTWDVKCKDSSFKLNFHILLRLLHRRAGLLSFSVFYFVLGHDSKRFLRANCPSRRHYCFDNLFVRVWLHEDRGVR